ncbi:ramp superfamily protein [Leptolyngbya sp. Heron Island J]|uniref:type III-D CRISPR-associated RAMP protein Csx10 n=1 Tax=Leptolyngbya sp. Heron Island J TaxID=1385935 RepID=UPI0003B9918D|nr:CRISPR-associated RAMP protein Csx10 [Leptolyngbya sp. Heron Island J]ESA32290.1 ramp superfamily protein [Leptolyngbya sp. Heron Island J]
MKVIKFQITNEEPVLVTSFQGDPNSDVSYDYIPGSTIRGFLISRYLRAHPELTEDILVDKTVRSLFFETETRFLNAYLSTGDKKHLRSLPAPLTWRHEKGYEDYILDKSYSSINEDEDTENERSQDTKKLVRIGQKFCQIVRPSSEHPKVILYRPQRRINIHNRRSRKRGRATKEEGQVYRYESLEAGQSFEAIILCNQGADATVLEQLLKRSQTARIGGSRTAGYGKVTISDTICTDADNWTEVGKPFQSRIRKNVAITLLSDAIICNDYGQYVVEAPIQAIANAMGVEQISQTPKIYMGSTFVGGFNRKWGLPLPQVQAVAAGSVFIFPDLDITPEQARQLEWQGIGERRNEGFGRVAVNWLPEMSEFRVEKPTQTLREKPLEKLSSTSETLAQKMASRLLRQKLDLALEKKLTEWPLSGEITNSQLSRLMLVANQALVEKQPDLINQFFANLRSNAKTKFESPKLGSQPLQKRCQTWLEKPKDTLWIDQRLTITIAGTTADVTQALGQEYALRLIIAIARKGIKQAAKQEG